MVFGIAGGLILFGLVAGALSGYVLLAAAFCIAGLLVAALWRLGQLAREERISHEKLAAYPSYKY